MYTYLIHVFVQIFQLRTGFRASLTLKSNIVRYPIPFISYRCLISHLFYSHIIIIIHLLKIFKFGLKIIDTLRFLFFLIQHILVNSI